MPLTLHDRQQDNLNHARWRVNFRRSLVDMHRAGARAGEDWHRKEAELLQWLVEAETELRRLELPHHRGEDLAQAS